MIESSEQIDALAAALAAFQGELEPVERGSENPFFKSRYADLTSVVEATRALRVRHGLAVVQLPSFDGTHDLLTTRIVHTSGQWLQATMRLLLVKNDPQGQGSAVTYARRYAYGGALGVVTEDDDDGNAGSPKAAKQKKGTPPASPAGTYKAERNPPVTTTNGTCPACQGSGERQMASGHTVPCPACTRTPAATTAADDTPAAAREAERTERGKDLIAQARGALPK